MKRHLTTELRTPERSDHRGFTLMEVLIGLTVAAMALSAGFATLGFMYDSDGPVDRASALALRGATTRNLLTEWLGEARARQGRRGQAFEGWDSEDYGNPTDSIVFPTTARTPLGVGTTVVRLYIDEDNLTPERGLVAALTELMADEPRIVELVPEAGSLDIRYLMPLEGTIGEWMPSWLSNRLPQAIELTLGPNRTDSLPPLLRYPLLVFVETTR
jgi:prepilin-type N-terminal cleavage/methylation domain-containing protein